MEPTAFIEMMQRVAPLELAEEWDNVGVLMAPLATHSVERVLLTIDVTDAVLDEAIAWRADAIVAYHPPLFSGLKRVLASDRVGRIVLRAAAAGLYLYSPHTALDAMTDGVNDWLAEAFDVESKVAIVPCGVGAEALVTGQGRHLVLAEPIAFDEAVARVKRHLMLDHLRLARSAPRAPEQLIGSVALCAGAGGSVVRRARADLILTGEMRHHDVLSAVEDGVSVILTEHSNSERGYLPRLRQRLLDVNSALVLRIADADRDPLAIG